MPKSRSGIIRQSIGPVKARLAGHIDGSTQQILGTHKPDDSVVCQKLIDDIAELCSKINNGITSLVEKDNKWQDIILALDDDESIADEEELYSKVASDTVVGYLTIIENAKDKICALERRQLELKRRLAEFQSNLFGSSGQSHRSTSVKLPKLNLPSFSGDHLQWPEFWSIFSINIHESSLGKAEKFAYLRGQLTGGAQKSIAGIPVAADNYELAVDVLKERYERTAVQLVGSLYSELKRLSPSSEKVSELVMTFDSCEKIFRQLQVSGEDVNSNRSLILEVFSKYPPKMVKHLIEHHEVGPHSNLADVREVIRKYIKRCQSMEEVMNDLNPFDKSSRSEITHKVPKAGHDNINSSLQQTSAFTAATTESSAPRFPCYFCSGKHFNSQCDVYKTPDERRQRVKAISRCLRCLGRGHQQESCRIAPDRIRCFFCKSKGDHVSPFCPQNQGVTKPTSDTTLPSASAGLDTANNLNVNENAVLLTARAFCRNPDGSGKRVMIRAIFDTGSHRSYITDRCASLMKLQTLQAEPLRVAVFGSKRTLTVASNRVALEIQQRDGSARVIHAHTTPIITNCPIRSRQLPLEDIETVKRLGRELADGSPFSESSVDVLIGSDYFWDFLQGSPSSTPSGLYVIPSTLGLLLGG